MEQRVYHGEVRPEGLAQALLDEWDREPTIAQAFGAEDYVVVQIGQRDAGWFDDEPRQALTLTIEPLTDGVQVTMGQQKWYKEQNVQIFVGGLVGLLPFFFGFPLGQFFGGDGDIPQTLPGRVWQSIDRYASSFGAATGKTQRLPTVACAECGVANPQGAERCSACGARLDAAPTCPKCGYSNPPGANFCNRCGLNLRGEA
ncbi:MAG TPA: zinc ribbon domain-containing protein [Herpetosiphonaceae bacterium]